MRSKPFQKLTTAAIAAVLLLLRPAEAQAATPKLVNVAANASAGQRTFTVANPNGAFNLLVVHANFTWSAATTVTFTCQESPDSGSTLYDLQDGLTASGAQTLSDATKVKAVVASKKWPMRWDISGFYFISCTYSAAGGGAGDIMNASTDLVTK